jgi:hypothetical protein
MSTIVGAVNTIGGTTAPVSNIWGGNLGSSIPQTGVFTPGISQTYPSFIVNNVSQIDLNLLQQWAQTTTSNINNMQNTMNNMQNTMNNMQSQIGRVLNDNNNLQKKLDWIAQFEPEVISRQVRYEKVVNTLDKANNADTEAGVAQSPA